MDNPVYFQQHENGTILLFARSIFMPMGLSLEAVRNQFMKGFNLYFRACLYFNDEKPIGRNLLDWKAIPLKLSI